MSSVVNTTQPIANTVANANTIAKAKPVVQRKKKTFPVVARCEGVETEEVGQLELSIADTLLNIIQAKPDIKAPVVQRKKKAISVADVIGSVSGIDDQKPIKKPRQPKKNKNETVATVIPEPVLENVESIIIEAPIAPEIVPLEQTTETVEQPIVPAPAPKQVKKRAPKKKVEAVIPEPVLENIESTLENNQIQETLGEIAETVVQEPAPKQVKKRAPKKKVEPVLENVESIIIEAPIAPEIVPLEQTTETVEQPIVPAPAPKQVKKRAPKKKVEAVIPEPVLENIESTLENNQIQETLDEIAETVVVVPETVVPAPAPKQVKKRAPKKKVEVVIPEPVLENIESIIIEAPIAPEIVPLEQTTETVEQPIVPAPAPKQVKKRAPKKKVEAVIPEPVLENVESTLENNQIQETLGEIAETVVQEPAPKQVKKRAPKKKVEVVIPEPVLENIESNAFDLTTIQDALCEIAPACVEAQPPMEWFDEQAKQIEIRREPILNTFFEPVPELDEEMYQINTLYENRVAPVEEYPVQPIYDGLNNIIANTLENEDYNDEIMVESLEFNGQTYWIDTQHNVLDKDTFEHIGLYRPETETIVFY